MASQFQSGHSENLKVSDFKPSEIYGKLSHPAERILSQIPMCHGFDVDKLLKFFKVFWGWCLTFQDSRASCCVFLSHMFTAPLRTDYYIIQIYYRLFTDYYIIKIPKAWVALGIFIRNRYNYSFQPDSLQIWNKIFLCICSTLMTPSTVIKLKRLRQC